MRAFIAVLAFLSMLPAAAQANDDEGTGSTKPLCITSPDGTRECQ